jgi:endogenous inhibitor of DNA gyrase (YacG/DUF329 family)
MNAATVRATEVRCTHCGAVVTIVKLNSKAPPFCSQHACHSAYQRWRYRNVPGVRERAFAASVAFRARQRAQRAGLFSRQDQPEV